MKKKRIKRFASATSIGIIGGADGPTAIFTRSRNERREKEWEQFLKKAAERLSPCEKDLSELGGYLAKKYNAREITLTDREREEVKVNLLLNSYGDYIKPLQPQDGNFDEQAFEQWQEQFAERVRQAHQIPEGQLGLEMHAYELPQETISTTKKQRRGRRGLFRRKPEIQSQQPVVTIELRSGYCVIHNGSEQLADDITLWRGVSQEDIEEQTPRFFSYVAVLKKLGKLDRE